MSCQYYNFTVADQSMFKDSSDEDRDQTIGRLELLFGPMYSSKSTTLLTIYNKYKLKYTVMVINHALDTQRSGAEIVSTHNNSVQSAICLHKLEDLNHNAHLKSMYKLADVIMIDEAQFFPDLKDFVIKSVEKDDKIVFVFGLSGNYKREKFGQVLDLVPYADKVSHLKAICNDCEGVVPAPFTKRIIKNDSEILIGAEEAYSPVCRKHYLQSK